MVLKSSAHGTSLPDRLAGFCGLLFGASARLHCEHHQHGPVQEALRNGAHHRLDVAQLASAYIAIPEWRRWFEATLAVLFNDDDVAVRGEAASCFRHLKDEVLDTYGDLLAVFCDSNAFREGGSFWFLRRLEKSLGPLPGTTCLVCEKFLDRFAGEARDIRTRRAGDTFTLAKLVFRTYQQH